MVATRRHLLLKAATIVAGWTFIAIAWTPPTILVERMQQPAHAQPPWMVFGFVFASFVPWIAATPALLQLGRRFPVTETSIWRPIAFHLAIGVVLIPLVTFCGNLLAVMLVPEAPPHALRLSALVSPVVITSLYSVPTYVAVAGIGQAMAYFDRYRLRERLLAQAELRALRSQLQPHFLFNALNAIGTLAYRDPALADRALTRLADLLRRVAHEQAQEIPLKDEIAFLKDYTDLHAILTPEPFAIEFEIAANAWNALVPTFVLQPLVENALRHGATKLAGGGRIAVSADTGDDLLLRVRNDAPREGILHTSSGIGLANLRERLRVLHGNTAYLRFERGADYGLATVRLPLREANGLQS